MDGVTSKKEEVFSDKEFQRLLVAPVDKLYALFFLTASSRSKRYGQKFHPCHLTARLLEGKVVF